LGIAAVAQALLMLPLTVEGATQSPAVRYAALLFDAETALGRGDVTTALGDVQQARSLAPSAGFLDTVAADLSAHPPDLADARARLHVAAAVLALPAGSGPAQTGDARRRLEDVYQRAAFTDLETPPRESGLAYWSGRFLRWLNAATVGRLGRIPTAILGTLAVAVVGLLALRALRRASAGRELRAAGELPTAGDDPDAEWAEAEAAAARGDHREAVRRAFRSALLSVAARGRLQLSAAWTTRELLAVARGDADLVVALAPAAAAFDWAWYSTGPVTEADWRLARARCMAIRHLAGRGLAPVR